MMHNSLKELYYNKICPDLMKQFKYGNTHEIPKLVKITLNRGLGEASQNAKALEKSIEEFTLITGQQPIVTRSKKSIAGFKIRENIVVGVTVTLRRHKMYNFLNKLINLSLPRIRDFRGISTQHFDGHGNYNIGVKEQLIFPEIEYEHVDKIRGMDIAIVTTAKNDKESLALLQAFGMPFC
ncbi:50S ribosomal protein L5 (plastid) [Chondrus crispus]|uniref:Large ribosomal subunit protein uL5c n=1 Tax=Chondrus crispus TaxID=2769 RepID=M5DDE4_CHOCR|nr:50S ribosomal protein L5 [Chondrus crispus]CCP38123.1 50S ribosomal protein L5 [Chondrus crispus]|eukprot:YP_007627376.1 50S ribosomal protein L5 (plastid) [Chondrus crispus]